MHLVRRPYRKIRGIEKHFAIFSLLFLISLILYLMSSVEPVSKAPKQLNNSSSYYLLTPDGKTLKIPSAVVHDIKKRINH